ncbi:protein MICROTUBULE BINDING PROTEIN 2C-like [Arachis duranensis]|uniref:Protein MICROTUBULE BINDING PROTEIN 2C-like n=1 Tax=Arachis duranensis TaxID=130453 RepID=A0A9C6T8C7_ARADU|nr:protein MICROTUBULE BINDING PROTEIN 2C-like [Arachis duranensis]XP_057740841.1 protein MICROTUBULE BINDING PROTEIN 2C-like [Arachis stenosperma]
MHEKPQHDTVGSEEEKSKPNNSCASESECEDNSSLTRSQTQSNLDRGLFNDLVQIVSLVHSLFDSKESSSFRRRGSMICTKPPSRDSLARRMSMLRKKENGELTLLRKQVEELQMKLLVKDELLESAEKSRNKLKALNPKLDELKNMVSEKDSLLRSTQGQLFDVKMKLADKQAVLEKLQWEAMTSNKKVEKLQEELDSVQGEILSFTLLLDGLKITNNDGLYTDDYDIKPHNFNSLPSTMYMDEVEMQKMEEARKAYIAAVAAAKEKQDHESIAIAANARLHFESFLFKPENLESYL